MGNNKKDNTATWQHEAVRRARILSRVKWTPVAKGMPVNKGKKYFEKGVEYTGVPYSSVKYVGRYIGFDIYLKTFLAAVQNPFSVLYTENLSGKIKNAGPYYGVVCSSYTSYGLGCAIWYISYFHNPPYREGVSLVDAQSTQTAQIGDIIYTPRSIGSHVEMITDLTKDDTGKVTHARVEDSWPATTRNINYNEEKFNEHLKKRKLYRIFDLSAWRGKNNAESFLFPNYLEDATTPVINRVLLLDRGDWVPYERGQVVRINIMDRDAQGVKKLVIKRGNKIIEEITKPGKGVIERSFPICGNYTAYCIMEDGSQSQSCEFAVCDLDFQLSNEQSDQGKPLEIEFSSNNMQIIIIYLYSDSNPFGIHNVFVTDEDRRKGKIIIPGNLLQDEGNVQIWLIGENKYGRLKKRQDIFIKK